jgi:hypothetical protein
MLTILGKGVYEIPSARNSVSIFTSVHCVFGTELAKIPRNYTEFHVAEFRVLRNSEFRGISPKLVSLILIFFIKAYENVRFFIFKKILQFFKAYITVLPKGP